LNPIQQTATENVEAKTVSSDGVADETQLLSEEVEASLQHPGHI